VEAKVIGPDAETIGLAVQRETVGPIPGMTEDEFATLASKILVIVPHRGDINAGLAQKFGYWSRFGTAIMTAKDAFGGFIELTRASIVRNFLDYCKDRPEVEFCVQIDSDEDVPWDAPYRLAQWDLPIVSGVICSYSQSRGIFACFTIVDDYGVARFPSWNITRNMPARGLVEAHSVGTGLVCVKKHVFETILASGDTPYILPDDERRRSIESMTLKLSEDTYFCRQASKHGFKCHVDLSVRGEHFKTVKIEWPLTNIDPDLDPRKWKVDTKDFLHV
jgi:hypothetical protein